MTRYSMGFLRSRLGHAAYFALAAWLLYVGVFMVAQRGLAGGPNLSLALAVIAFGLRLLWNERNLYLRAFLGADRHLFRGALLERRGMILRALHEYALHEARFPGNWQAIERRALLLARVNRFVEAIAELDQMLTPYADPACLNMRAWLFHMAGLHEEALADALAASPMTIEPWTRTLAIASLTELRRLDDALRLIDELPGNQTQASFLHAKANVMRLLGRQAEALEYYEEVVKTYLPVSSKSFKDHTTLECVIASLWQLDRVAEARALLEQKRTRSLMPGFCLQTHLACLQLGSGDITGAIPHLGKVLEERAYSVVSLMSDPECSRLLSDERLRALFSRAVARWQNQVSAIRAR
jgi:tetratricopeptide (TPR) repeat protein